MEDGGQRLCFVLIQTYFAFSIFAALPGFEGFCVRHTVVLALLVLLTEM